MKSNLTLTSLLVFLLTGCGNTDSTSVSTKHIYMKAYVYETNEDNESSAYINVVMREDSTLKPEIYLSDGEYLTASFDGEKEVRLEEREIGEAVWPIFSLRGVWSDFRYTAEIPTSGEIGTFIITFHRLDGSKIPMRVEMVERVMLSSPTVDDIFFENQSIPLQWSLPYWRDTQMELETQFFCQDYTFIKEQKNYDIDDNGDYTFPTHELVALSNKTYEINQYSRTSNDCNMTLNLVRYRSVPLSNKFAKSSYIEASRSSNLNVTVKLDL
ncbi:hypothetical protein [Pseudoalteromonas spongiae]|uniref:hypothetical protein n=1 Tax=Pseudoalteromonas spongiae TaxID=298657 RepID=UPI00110B3235|nr:hypothetical protein [Pseudoalteromonas spongiae]TMO88708.1 hypothetical protein CWC15_01705 [Pseudoalteromonas spongiae]